MSSTRQKRTMFWRRQVPSWNEEKIYLSGTQDLGQKRARTSGERAEDFKRHMGWVAKEKMPLGPCGSFKIWLQIPWHSYHQKVGTQPILNLGSLIFFSSIVCGRSEAKWSLRPGYRQTFSFFFLHWSPRKAAILWGSPKYMKRPRVNIPAVPSLPVLLAQAQDIWMKRASNDSTPRHSSHPQPFKFSQRRLQTLWNREKPTPSYSV